MQFPTDGSDHALPAQRRDNFDDSSSNGSNNNNNNNDAAGGNRRLARNRNRRARAKAAEAAAAAMRARVPPWLTRADIERIFPGAGVHIVMESGDTDAEGPRTFTSDEKRFLQKMEKVENAAAASDAAEDSSGKDREAALERLYKSFEWRMLLDPAGNPKFVRTSACPRSGTFGQFSYARERALSQRSEELQKKFECHDELPPGVEGTDVVGLGVCVRCFTRRSGISCRGCAALHKKMQDEEMADAQNRVALKQRARELQERLRALPTRADAHTSGNVLPVDVLLHVFSTLDLKALGLCSQVCRLWYAVCVRTASIANRAEELLLPAVLKALPHCTSLSSDLGVPFVHRLTRFRGTLPDSALPALLENCPFMTDLDITGLSVSGVRSLCSSQWTVSVKRLSILNYLEIEIIDLILKTFKNLEHLLVATDCGFSWQPEQLRTDGLSHSLSSLGLIDFDDKFGPLIDTFAVANTERVHGSTEVMPKLKNLVLIRPVASQNYSFELKKFFPTRLQSCEIRHAQLEAAKVISIVQSNARTLQMLALDGCSFGGKPESGELLALFLECEHLSKLRLPCEFFEALPSVSRDTLGKLFGSLTELSIGTVRRFSSLASGIASAMQMGGIIRELRIDVPNRQAGGNIDGDTASTLFASLLSPAWANLEVLDLNYGCLDDKAWSEVIIAGGLSSAPMLRFFCAAVGSSSGALSALACITQAVEFAPRRIQCIVLYDSDNSSHRSASVSDVALVDDCRNLTIHVLKCGEAGQAGFNGDPLGFIRAERKEHVNDAYNDPRSCSSCDDVLHREHPFPLSASAVSAFMRANYPTKLLADDTVLIRQQKTKLWTDWRRDAQELHLRADCVLVRTGIADDV